MTPIYNYVSVITFTDLSPVPVRSAVKLYFTSCNKSQFSIKRASQLITQSTRHTLKSRDELTVMSDGIVTSGPYFLQRAAMLTVQALY